MKKALGFILVIVLLSCSKDSYLELESPIIIDSEESLAWHVDHNLWTYTQMKEHYFWYDEMPDSLSLDFTQEPSTFFESLKSKQDRFSWCEINRNYKATRGTNISETVSLDTVYTIGNHRIGYIVYEQFEESSDVLQIMLKMQYSKITDFILDLRGNPGGYVNTCNYLASFLVPPKKLGQLFLQERYNDKITHQRKLKYGGEGIDSVYLSNSSQTRKYNLDLYRIFILISSSSASSSEALIIGLRPFMEVITIGQTSVGKDVGSYTIANNNYKYQLQPITLRYYNAVGDSTPIAGIVPDIPVEFTGSNMKGDISDPCLQAAFDYINNN